VFLGRYQLGQEVTFRLLTRDPSGQPLAPTAAPVMTVYAPGGRVISGNAIPSRDRPAATGLFEGRVFLSEAFTEGRHTITVRWLYAGAPYCCAYTFEVIPGGDGSGQVNALYSYVRPGASYLVQGRSSGRIYKGKNPRA
jgi:hypothetical protein